MFYYLFIFFISLLTMHYARKTKGKTFIIFSIMALLPPILLAGFRDISVGSDTSFYIVDIFKEAVATKNDFSVLLLARGTNFEPLFLFVNFAVAQITDKVYLMLIVEHALVMIPLYVSAMKWKKKISPTFFMFIFYFTFYNDTLSIIRQSIAISFSILAFSLYCERKYKKFAVNMLIAFMFHHTAIIALMFPLLLWLVKNYPFKRNMNKYLAIILLMTFFVIFLDNAIMAFVYNGIINEKYLEYTSQSDVFKGRLGLTNFIVKLLTLSFVTYKVVKRKRSLVFYDFCLMIAITDLSLSICGIHMEPLLRLSFYSRIMTCITMPFLMYRYKLINRRTRNFTFKTIYSFAIVVYWFYVYIYGDQGATSIYKFA